MRKLLALAAVSEAATGLVLLVYPPIVVWLLFGTEIAGAEIVISRFAGIALIALGVACWPGSKVDWTLCGMLTYSSVATLYLGYLGVTGEWVGQLLWPAVVAHAVVTILFAHAWLEDRQAR